MTEAIVETGIVDMEEMIRQAHGLDIRNKTMKTIVDISREIPDDASSLIGSVAEHLAGRFLRGLDLCGELYSLASSYEMKTELIKKKEFSNAMLIRSSEHPNVKTAKEKEMFAFSDEGYLAQAEKHIAAKMFRIFIEEKKEAFYKAHYMMRKIVDREGTVGDNGFGQTDNETNTRKETDWYQTSR